MLSRSRFSILLSKVCISTPFDHQQTSLPHMYTSAKLLEKLNKSTNEVYDSENWNIIENHNKNTCDDQNIELKIQKLSAIVDEVKTAYIYAEAAHRSYYRRYKNGLKKVKIEAKQILEISSNNNGNDNNDSFGSSIQNANALRQWAKNKCVQVRDPLDSEDRRKQQPQEKQQLINRFVAL